MHQSFLLSRPRKKNMCVYYCMEKLNRVDRLENVFVKKLCMGIIERKKKL